MVLFAGPRFYQSIYLNGFSEYCWLCMKIWVQSQGLHTLHLSKVEYFIKSLFISHFLHLQFKTNGKWKSYSLEKRMIINTIIQSQESYLHTHSHNNKNFENIKYMSQMVCCETASVKVGSGCVQTHLALASALPGETLTTRPLMAACTTSMAPVTICWLRERPAGLTCLRSQYRWG